MLVDLRSDSEEELNRLDEELLAEYIENQQRDNRQEGGRRPQDGLIGHLGGQGYNAAAALLDVRQGVPQAVQRFGVCRKCSILFLIQFSHLFLYSMGGWMTGTSAM